MLGWIQETPRATLTAPHLFRLQALLGLQQVRYYTVWSTICICISFMRPPRTVIFRELRLHLTKIRRRELNINCS